MQFQFNSDNQTDVGADVATRVEEIVRARLDRLAGRLTRVEVHLGEADGAHAGSDEKRCTIEARPTGLDPASASHHSAGIEAAVTGTADKLLAVLDRQIGKQTTRKGH